MFIYQRRKNPFHVHFKFRTKIKRTLYTVLITTHNSKDNTRAVNSLSKAKDIFNAKFVCEVVHNRD